jgi:hypothetical protein
MDVQLHIERLVLDGVNVTPHERAVLVLSFQSELSRLIQVHGLSEGAMQGFAAPSLPSCNASMSQPFKAGGFGVELARSLYSGLGRPRE